MSPAQTSNREWAMILRLTRAHIRLLVKETRKSYPVEACGLLFGDTSSGEAVVKRIVAVKNMLESSTNFQVDPQEFFKALSKAGKSGMQHIGFFHSHPAAPQPSATDISYMRLWPENIWLIISSIDYAVAAYRTEDDAPREVAVRIDKEC